MFALPDAKRIRRSDLYADRSSSPPADSPNPELEAQLRARLASLFPPLGPQDDVSVVTPEIGVEDAEEEVEFRLFGGPGEAVQRIILKDEFLSGDGGLVNATDPRVWFLPKASGERRVGLEMMAVSGEQVLEAAGRRAWGLEVPWRVRIVRQHGKSGGSKDSVIFNIGSGDAVEDAMARASTDNAAGKRKKVGKKRRILLRERKKKLDELEMKMRVESERKAESEKEKKIRKNRERKLKRRLKEKAKKTGGGVVEESGDVDMDLPDSQDGDND